MTSKKTRKTYFGHLFNWTRLSSAAWVLFGAVVAQVLVEIQQTDVMTLTWFQVKAAVVTAVVTQLTKAWTSYVDSGKDVVQ